jgi:hypothetical protein
MATAVLLSRKDLWLIVEAMEQRIAAEEARYTREDSGEDAAGDFGNDLWYLKMLRDQFAVKRDAGNGTATLYQCWADEAEGSLSLLRFQDVQQHRDQALLRDTAKLLYEFAAESGEEAAAIHNLRQGWAPYIPMGDAAPCPTCRAMFYPVGYGDCWRCGHIG